MNSCFVVKVTGGGTAQLLALTNAIHISQRTSRSFLFRYYPFSTGTYWPLQIEPLLMPNEFEIVEDSKRWSQNGLVKEGEWIQDFALRRGGINREKILYLLKKKGFEKYWRAAQREIVIGGLWSQLQRVNPSTKIISGNFVPIMNERIATDLDSRLSRAGLESPFQVIGIRQDVVIHYRLGDMRRMPARVPGMGGHGVVDPSTFYSILNEYGFNFDSDRVTLVSDEPAIAAKALDEVGISSVASKPSSFWDDLRTISSANLFLGSLSQFSLFGALLCLYNGGKAVLPSNVYGEGDTQSAINNYDFQYFSYRYLAEDHWIFKA